MVIMRNTMEDELVLLWPRHAVRPTNIRVNPELMKWLSKHRPGGGNSKQRRTWKRMWEPRLEELSNEHR